MFNRRVAFTLNMSENLELCPKCKQGHLRDTHDTAVKVEIQPPFRQTGSSTRQRICDYCGHRQIDQYLNEYGEPASDLLSGTAIKPNPEGKREE
jgi:C4-type Zn-finger protein